MMIFSKENKPLVLNTLKISIPSMIESFFVCLVGLIDSLMVSSLGPEAVASVGLSTQPKLFILAPFMAISVSVSALVARRYGEKDRKGACGILSTALMITLLFVLIISSLFVIFANEFLELCGTSSDTHTLAVDYFRIIAGGMIFNVLALCINAAQRGIGNTKITLRSNVTSNTVNVIFNYLLIGGKFGFPALGIKGAAIATVLGSVVGCIMSIWSIMNHNCFVSIFYILKNRVFFAFSYLKSVFKIGYGILCENMLMRIGFMATAIMAADQGTYAMAAHQVCMNILSLSFAFGDGLQSASVALVGKSLGEKNPDNAKKYASICQNIGGIITIFMAILFILGGEWMMTLFFDEPEIIAIGQKLIFMSIAVVLFQIRQIIYMSSLRGAGDTLFTAICASTSTTLVRTFVSYLFAYPLGLGILGVWVGIVGDQVSRFICGYLRFKSGKWVNIKI